MPQLQTMLRAMMNPFRPRLLAGPEILVGNNKQQFDESGRLINERNLAALTELMETLRAEAGAVSAANRAA